MFNTKKILVMLLLVILVGSFANAYEYRHKEKKEYSGKMTKEIIHTGQLIGASVTNQRKEELGSIVDLVFDPVQEQAEYAVLSTAGFLGMGEKYIAVPWEEMQFDPKKQQVTVDIRKSQLESVKGFDKSSWPNEAESLWQKITEKTEEYMQEGQQSFNKRKVSEIIGLSVQNPQGNDMANIEHLAFEKDGQLKFAILSYGGFFDQDEQMVAIPWQALGFRALPEMVAVLDTNQETLDSLAFKYDQMPDLTDSSYTEKLQKKFGQRASAQILGFAPAEPEKMSIQPWLEDSEYNKNFDPENIKTMQVKVKNVGTFYPTENSTPGLRLKGHAEGKDRLCTIYAGPKSYFMEKGYTIKNGDQLKVIGSITEIGWREVIMATDIHKGDKKIKLRDQQGQPQWSESELKSLHEEHMQKMQEKMEEAEGEMKEKERKMEEEFEEMKEDYEGMEEDY